MTSTPTEWAVRAALIKRLLVKADMSGPSKCWLWQGSCSGNGYGRFSINGELKSASRTSYELFRGEIPDGWEIDHLCRQRGCINPVHLEAVTRSENHLRGFDHLPKALQTHCRKGHELTDDNVYRYSNGKRQCLTCRRVSLRKAAAKYATKHRHLTEDTAGDMESCP